ncbi:MAG TPA: lysophospholipid acyltransferase family protein [Pirellulales bacterium]|nr:lysophospholipid acyltransferase family protein [Pirellulales bacterium]
MNRQPFRLKSPQWDARLSPFWVRLMRPLRRRKQVRDQRLLQISVRGAERMRPLVEQNAGILITPNHPSHADCYAMYEAAESLGRPFYFMTAWQVLAMSNRFQRWVLRRHGSFSVEREGADLWAFKRAVRVLVEESYPLVIFPEGDVYHLNDKVTPFRDGTAAIALTASRQTERPLYVVPCALRFEYVEDPTRQLESVMTELEERILWRPRPHLPLSERIYHFAEALLSVKELEYAGTVGRGSLRERIEALVDHVLSGLEQAHGLKNGGQTVPERVKNVRRACLEEQEKAADDPARLMALRTQLDDVFFVVQLFSYPGDYVKSRPTIERLAETLDKFEEDVLGYPTARIRGTRRAIVEFGEPIDVRQFAEGMTQPRKASRPLTNAVERAVQALLDGDQPKPSPPVATDEASTAGVRELQAK